MPPESREERLAAALVELADTLVSDFDVDSFLHRLTEHCADLLDVSAAGVLLATPRGGFLEASASDERARALELAGLQWDEGPCLDCYRTATPLPDTPLGDPHARANWPRFSPRAQQLGFTSVAATPMRLRETAIGALNLLRDREEPLADDQLRLAQALADAATIGILQQRAVTEQAGVATQLQNALESRIVIEQAKGALAQRRRITIDEAFQLLRQYARRHRRLLTEVAREVVEEGFDPAAAGGK